MRIKYSVARNKRKKEYLSSPRAITAIKTPAPDGDPAGGQILTAAYTHRKDKKGDVRQMWIVRLNAATREEGMTYSTFINGLKKANICSTGRCFEMAIKDPSPSRAS